MITFLLACLLIYVSIFVLLFLIGFCSYVNNMFVESCEDFKRYFKK